MSNLLTILLVLFIALIIVIPLLEKFSGRLNNASAMRLGRYILPLVMILLVLQLLLHWFK